MANNLEYNMPHSMAKGETNVAETQKFLNATHDRVKEEYKTKVLPHCSPHQRCYIKSMFDIVDFQDIGYIRYQDMAPRLNIILGDHEVGPDPEHILQFFASYDTDNIGTINFEKFLYGMVAYLNSKEPKKGKKSKKSKKRKDAFSKK